MAPLADWPLAFLPALGFAPICVATGWVWPGEASQAQRALLQGPGGLQCLWRGRGRDRGHAQGSWAPAEGLTAPLLAPCCGRDYAQGLRLPQEALGHSALSVPFCFIFSSSLCVSGALLTHLVTQQVLYCTPAVHQALSQVQK